MLCAAALSVTAAESADDELTPTTTVQRDQVRPTLANGTCAGRIQPRVTGNANAADVDQTSGLSSDEPTLSSRVCDRRHVVRTTCRLESNTFTFRVGRRSHRTLSTDFEIFRRRFDGVGIIYFFNSDFKFFDDASEFSVTS